MFEITYLRSANNNDVAVTNNPAKVGYSRLGVSIQINEAEADFIPWNRVTRIRSSIEAIDTLMSKAPFDVDDETEMSLFNMWFSPRRVAKAGSGGEKK